jgi:hypothetical protein
LTGTTLDPERWQPVEALATDHSEARDARRLADARR